MELPNDNVILESVKELLSKHPGDLKSILNGNGKRRISQLESDNEELRNCLKMRKEHLDSECKKNDALTARNNHCKSRIRSLTSQLKTKDTKISEVEKKCKELVDKVNAVVVFEARISGLAAENASLKRSLEEHKESARRDRGILAKFAALAGGYKKDLSRMFETADGETDDVKCLACLNGKLSLQLEGHELAEYTCVGGCGGKHIVFCPDCYHKHATTLQVCTLCRHPDSYLVPSSSIAPDEDAPDPSSASVQPSVSAAPAIPSITSRPVPHRTSPPAAAATSRQIRIHTEEFELDSDDDFDVRVQIGSESGDEVNVSEMLRARRRLRPIRTGTLLRSGETSVRPGTAGGYSVLSIRRTPGEPIVIPDSPEEGRRDASSLDEPQTQANTASQVTSTPDEVPETEQQDGTSEHRSDEGRGRDGGVELVREMRRGRTTAVWRSLGPWQAYRPASPAYTPSSPDPHAPAYNDSSPDTTPPDSPVYRPTSPGSMTFEVTARRQR
jgi:hypothetical protein